MTNPTCRHCNYEFDCEETWYGGEVSTGDSDISTLTCPNLDCGKKFVVQCEHVVTFNTLSELDEEDYLDD